MFKPIYDEQEHLMVLLELNLLDDDDNWQLYNQQEQKFREIDAHISLLLWAKYVK